MHQWFHLQNRGRGLFIYVFIHSFMHTYIHAYIIQRPPRRKQSSSIRSNLCLLVWILGTFHSVSSVYKVKPMTLRLHEKYFLKLSKVWLGELRNVGSDLQGSVAEIVHQKGHFASITIPFTRNFMAIRQVHLFLFCDKVTAPSDNRYQQNHLALQKI